jgi:membrane peptidoglycan carboxypeptidase
MPRTRTSSNRSSRAAARASDPSGRRSIVWRWRRVLFLLGLVFVLSIAGVGYLFAQVPLPDAEPPLLQTTFMCSAEVSSGCNGDNSIAQLSGGVDRVSVTYEQLPPVLINAVVATEDRSFFEHQGVDPVGIARAFWANVRSEEVTQGGSTITQQYVKNVYLSQERTFSRKLKEASLAVKVERELSKQEILTRYLNVIYFGRGAYGVQAASKTYFGVDVEDLSLTQAAYLAGLIRAPELADAKLPDDDPRGPAQRAEARVRRNNVLDAMLEEGYITDDEHAVATAAGWDEVTIRTQIGNFGKVARQDLGTEYFVEYVRHWLVTQGGFTDAEVFGGGLRVYTTLDFAMQEQAVEAISSTLDRPDDPAASLVSVDQQGRVRAMVGGLDFDESKVNLAVGRDGGGSGRGPGSAFKAVALAEALKQGVSLNQVYDAPAKKVFEGADAGDDWEVGNYADAGLGRLNLVDATRQSSNTAYAQLVLDVGPDNTVSLARRMGIAGELPEVPSIVLGTGSVSVLDMATAYSTFANNGEHIGPFVVSRVTDADGTLLYQSPTERDRVISEEVAQQVNWTLSQVIESGTGTGAKIAQPAAGKTGTTENYRDAWFVGYTCSLTTAVWMGYPGVETRFMENVHGREVTGGSFPATIWRKFMSSATDGLPSCPFERPAVAPAPSGTFVPGTQPPTSGTSVAPSTTTTVAEPEPPPTEAPTTTAAPTTTTTAQPTTTTTAAAADDP